MDAAPARTGHYRFIGLALITVILALSTAYRATLSIAGPHMSKDLGLKPVQLGWLFSSFAWAYVVGHLPAGWLVGKLGAKLAINSGLVLWPTMPSLMSGVDLLAALALDAGAAGRAAG